MRKRRSMATDDRLIKAIEGLRSAGRRDDVPLWKDLSRRLSAPRRNRAGVNVSSLARYTEKGDVVAVPGKVLGSGTIAHPLTVAACSFTA
ncbi:MAG: 50S ribosomal protein L18e, partial [Methanobacteriota archaeon]